MGDIGGEQQRKVTKRNYILYIIYKERSKIKQRKDNTKKIKQRK